MGGPHVGAAPAAGRAGEARLDIRQPHMIRPAVGADLDVMAAFVVAAIDQNVAHAGFAHFAESDFFLRLAQCVGTPAL